MPRTRRWRRQPPVLGAFAGELPADLASNMKRQSVRELLGSPHQEAGPKAVPVLSGRPALDLFEFRDYDVYVEYDHAGKVFAVTVQR